jgi:hypothetical protein
VKKRALCLVVLVALVFAAAPGWAQGRVAATPVVELVAWLSAAWSSFTAFWAGDGGGCLDPFGQGSGCIDPNGQPVSCPGGPTTQGGCGIDPDGVAATGETWPDPTPDIGICVDPNGRPLPCN